MNLTYHSESGSTTASRGQRRGNPRQRHRRRRRAGFLPHGTGRRRRHRRHVVPLLTPHYTVIVVDNGACGSRSPPDRLRHRHDGRRRRRAGRPTWASASSASPARTGARPSPTPSPPSTGPGCGNWCSRKRSCPDCQPAQDARRRPRPLARRSTTCRTGWHFSFFSLPNLPELLLAGRERPFWTWFARRQMWDPSALAEEDIDEMVHSAEQPGGTRAILEVYRARQTDAEQNRPHYADPISCPVLAVGAQAHLGDDVAKQLEQVARDVRRVDARPRSQHRPGEPSRPWPRPTSTSSPTGSRGRAPDQRHTDDPFGATPGNRSCRASTARGKVLPLLRQCPDWVRICRRSELSSAAAITVIAVTAIGAGKLRSSATSWSSAAPTAQISTAAAARSIARRIISRAFARTPAMPVSHAGFAFCQMMMAAIVPPPLLTMTSYAERST